MNITQREAEMIRTALSTLMLEASNEEYAALLEQLVLSPEVHHLSDIEGFLNDSVPYQPKE
ncbi:MAG: hypothetical protein WBV93_04745 [Anaerobacillus sp.]